MDVLGDVVARERRSGAPALGAPALDRRYDYRRFCTGAWKVGNFMRHLGVRSGVAVAVADELRPEPVLAFYGAALLGAVVRFGPPETVDDDTRAVVVGADDLDGYEFGPGTKPLVYGGRHDDPSAARFDRDVWSENPTEPPDHVDRDDPLLRTPEEEYDHGEVLEAAGAVVDRQRLEPGSTVSVRGSLAEPGVVAAGLVAPLLAGGVVDLATGTDPATGDLVVGGSDSDVDLATVPSDGAN